MKLFFKKTTLSVLEKIGVLMKEFHIRPIQKIVYSFDPFAPNVLSCRYWPFPSVVISFRGEWVKCVTRTRVGVTR